METTQQGIAKALLAKISPKEPTEAAIREALKSRYGAELAESMTPGGIQAIIEAMKAVN